MSGSRAVTPSGRPADRIARGVQAGKVPSHASVSHDTDTFWGDLLDAADVVAALKAVSTESEPPPPPRARPRAQWWRSRR